MIKQPESAMMEDASTERLPPLLPPLPPFPPAPPSSTTEGFVAHDDAARDRDAQSTGRRLDVRRDPTPLCEPAVAAVSASSSVAPGGDRAKHRRVGHAVGNVSGDVIQAGEEVDEIDAPALSGSTVTATRR